MEKSKRQQIELTINHQKIQLEVHPLTRLLDVLRDELGLTGCKEGCGEGECGACSVLIDGKLVNACIALVGSLEGAAIITIEEYSKTDRFKILESCFMEAGAVQCGICTPGMILAAEALLSEVKNPTVEEIRQGVSGNICRCTGYNMIVDAIVLASERGRGLW